MLSKGQIGLLVCLLNFVRVCDICCVCVHMFVLVLIMCVCVGQKSLSFVCVFDRECAPVSGLSRGCWESKLRSSGLTFTNLSITSVPIVKF